MALPANHATGQTITAADVNAIETAVNALSGTSEQPAVVVAAPTGVAATDQAALEAAIAACPAGGRVQLRTGTYALNAALLITKSLTLAGDGVSAAFVSLTSGGSSTQPSAPYLTGTVLKQTTAGVDGVQITAAGASVNLRDFGVLFAEGLASTGHGVNGTTTQGYSTGHDYGPTAFEWRNVLVARHDGNHFGFVLTNPQYGTLTHCEAYFGGGFKIVTDAGGHPYGNLVVTHPYVALSNAGSAGAFVLSAAAALPNPGSMNLCTFIRPQCFISGAAATAGTQPTWDETAGAATPSNIVVISADLETAGANPYLPSIGSQWVAPTQMNSRSLTNTVLGTETLAVKNGHINNTVFGYRALQNATSAASCTAIGSTALRANTSGNQNTAIGQNAMVANLTGSNNVAIGFNAMPASTATDACIAIGREAMLVSTGTQNVAVGDRALVSNTTGQFQTAIGANALHDATTNSNNNTAVGKDALYGVTTGYSNVGVGHLAGYTETTANKTTTVGGCVFVGYGSGQPSTTQSPMVIAIGFKALAGGSTTGYGIAIGANTSVTAAGAVAIGTDNAGTGAASTVANTMVLGTSLHKHRLPGLPSQAFVSGDKYVVADSNGNLHLSALGPAS